MAANAVLTAEQYAKLPPHLKKRALDLMRRKAYLQGLPRIPDPWPEDIEAFLKGIAPAIARAPMGPHHLEFWDHVSQIVPGTRPQPIAFFVNRGGAKSASAELAVVVLGALKRRNYFVYLSGTQELSDDHVASIASLLESPLIAERYPGLADRKLGKFGPRAWRRNRLQTASGLIVDSLGLDVGARGRRIEEQRPDGVILDDFDASEDSAATVLKKIRTISGTIIPMGSPDLAIIVAQNLIHENSIARRICYPDLFPKEEQILVNRKVVGPISAVEDLEFEIQQQPSGERIYVITKGTATWEGLPLKACEAALNDVGPSAFLREYQHDVSARAGGIFSHCDFKFVDEGEVPWGEVVGKVIALDPAVTSTDHSDSQGLAAGVVTNSGHIYITRFWEGVVPATDVLEKAIFWCHETETPELIVEVNQGGDVWASVFKLALASLRKSGDIPKEFRPKLTYARVGSKVSKIERATSMVPEIDRHEIMFVRGRGHKEARDALYRFPLPPLDGVDGIGHLHRALRRFRPPPSAAVLAGANAGSKSGWTMPGAPARRGSGGGWNLGPMKTTDGVVSWRPA